jgi:broad specificity phosphatase PhoE|tara:strand:- start:6001 stop:6621 length:621 start_codon:yes stop_codon:yes gene_type:complete
MRDNSNFTLIDILRHGQCQGGEIYRGSTDVALTDLGWQQMRNAVAPHNGWDAVVSSPLTRCKLFAQEHAAGKNIPITVENDFREIHFGEWEGQLVSEVWKNDQEFVMQYYSQPGSVTPVDGEHIQDVQNRVVAAFDKVLADYKNKHVLVVQHGGTIRLLLAHLMQSPLTAITRIEVAYASMTRIKVFHQGDSVSPVIVGHYPGEEA